MYSMATLTIDIVFDALTDDELHAAKDQIDIIIKTIEKKISQITLGDYYSEISWY